MIVLYIFTDLKDLITLSTSGSSTWVFFTADDA